MDEIVLSKVASLERCIQRIREEYRNCNGNIKDDILRQDSIVLNLERACEQCIDIGQRVIRRERIGLAKEYREVFKILAEHHYISNELSEVLQKMVGFRNIAIHDYMQINMDILKHIIEHRLEDLLLFAKILMKVEP